MYFRKTANPTLDSRLAQIAAYVKGTGSGQNDHPIPGHSIMPDTTIIRYWRNRNYIVKVTTEGYIFEDTEYKSLSAIARQITGTHWSGNIFFGLRKGLKLDGADE